MLSVPTSQIRLCNDAATLRNAMKRLRNAKYIVCDCEGVSLGTVGGSLSIISLFAVPTTAAPTARFYLIDAVALSNQDLQPVFDILRSSEHIKIMFDGRKDWSELYHRHGVRLDHVLDMQLADIESRGKRGEDIYQQAARLSTFFGVQDVRDQQRLVHRLNGLEGCAKEHGVIGRWDDVKPRNFAHDRWEERPLSSVHLNYAAADLLLIGKVYQTFLCNGYIDEATLLVQSRRFLAIHMRGLPPANSGHSLLPLNILSVPATPSNGETIECAFCRRTMPSKCFPAPGRASEARGCWVCRATGVRLPAQPALDKWQDFEDALLDEQHGDDYDDYDDYDDVRGHLDIVSECYCSDCN